MSLLCRTCKQLVVEFNRKQTVSLRSVCARGLCWQHKASHRWGLTPNGVRKTRNLYITFTQFYQQQRLCSQQSPNSTIDEEEVKKFSELANLWWDESGEFEALHSLNEIRVPLIRDALVAQRQLREPGWTYSAALPLDGMTVVDVGSGGGLLSEPLARLGASVIGVDASEENIKVAKAHLRHFPRIARRINYQQSTVEDMVATESGNYDAVVASEVVEHVADVPTFVSACCKLLKPGGSIFLTTINKTYLSYVLGVLGAEYLLRLVSPGTHDWNKFIPPQDLQFILDQNECSTRLLHGMMYNPLTKRWSWITNTSVSYAIHAIRAPTSASDQDPSSGTFPDDL